MEKSIPVFVKQIFKDRLSELCGDLRQVEGLLKSSCEWERAGAVVIFATPFKLEMEAVKAKLDDCLSLENSEIVRVQINYYLTKLEVAMRFEDLNVEILAFASADYCTQLDRIKNGTHTEKLGAIKFAELRNTSEPSVAAELYERSFQDGNSEIRCTALRAISEAFIGTWNKEVGSVFAKFALNQNEEDEVRVCAAYEFLSVFKPVDISRNGITLMKPTLSENRAHLRRMRYILEFGVKGIDTEYIEGCLAE